MAEIAHTGDVSIVLSESSVANAASMDVKAEEEIDRPAVHTPVQKRQRESASSSATKTASKKKKQEYTSVPKTLQGVKDMVQAWGYEGPDSASKCALAGLARGVLQVYEY
jgi:hypothetical protein